jgi:hypothetical protein
LIRNREPFGGTPFSVKGLARDVDFPLPLSREEWDERRPSIGVSLLCRFAGRTGGDGYRKVRIN